jgi:pyruvate dehydrogenase E2 component (dihydrolipoamide acetyltransferase)
VARLLRMPEVAANAVEAVLSQWQVAENAPFAAQDAIATVETEKAVVDVPADADGVVLRFLVAAGTEVEVGTPIALVGDAGEQVDDLDALLAALGVAGDPTPADLAPAPVAEPEPTAATTIAGPGVGSPVPIPGPRRQGRVFSSPLARKLAREAGLAVEQLAGTGPGGRIVRRDVAAALADRAPTPVTESPAALTPTPTPTPSPVIESPNPPPPATLFVDAPQLVDAPQFVDVPHSRMRRAIAARLTQSVTQAPHFSVRGSARVDGLLALRAELNATGGPKVSITDLVLVAAARAHERVPDLNVGWTPDAVRRFTGVDIAVAVATDRGLVTPVLRGLERLRVSQVAVASADLIARARAGRLQQHELEGGSLTVTNLGGYGIEDFTAIINPPQAAILAVGATRQEAVVVDGELAVATVLRFTVSVDHRPVDGAVAAQWVAAFTTLLEHPPALLA